MKGAFNGLLFAEFPTLSERDWAITKIRQGRQEWDGRVVWAKVDLPLEERLPESFAFSVKKLMVKWGWSKHALVVDRDTSTLYLGSDKVLSSSVSGNSFKVQYGDGWENDLKYPNFTEMLNQAQCKVTMSKGMEKGKGKAGAARR